MGWFNNSNNKIAQLKNAIANNPENIALHTELISLEPIAQNYVNRGHFYAKAASDLGIQPDPFMMKFLKTQDGTNVTSSDLQGKGLFFTESNVNKHKELLLKAVDDYNKAISLDPSFLDAYFNRGLAYFDLHKDNLAKQDALFLQSKGDHELARLLKQRGIL